MSEPCPICERGGNGRYGVHEYHAQAPSKEIRDQLWARVYADALQRDPFHSMEAEGKANEAVRAFDRRQQLKDHQ